MAILYWRQLASRADYPAIARRTFSGSSQYLVANTPIAVPPMSLWIEANPASVTVNHETITLHNGGASTNFAFLLGRSDGAINATQRGPTAGTDDSSADAPASTMVLNQWESWGGSFSASSTNLYFGRKKWTAAPSATLPVAFSQLVIGANQITAFLRYWNGSLRRAGVWNVQLTDAEFFALNAGEDPYKVRRESLQALYFLGASEDLRDWGPRGNRYPLTDASTTKTVGAPYYRLRRSRIVYLNTEVVAGGVNGALSVTLGALTSSATATVEVAGTLSKTLGALTSTATATVEVAGTLSKTLGALTSSAAAAVEVQGVLASTLGAATLASTIVVADGPTGELSVTLGALSLAATATVEVAGTASITLGALTSVATGTVDILATLAATLGGLSLTATGIVLDTVPPDVQNIVERTVAFGDVVIRTHTLAKQPTRTVRF